MSIVQFSPRLAIYLGDAVDELSLILATHR